MTKKRTGKSGILASPEDEACRRLMTSLYGSEAKAIAVAEALVRELTPNEEALVRQRYDIGDELADQVAREAEVSDGAEIVPLAGAPRPLTQEEEREFDAFMETVYRRAQAEEDRRRRIESSIEPLSDIASVASRLVQKWQGRLSDMIALPMAPNVGFARLSTQEPQPTEGGSQSTKFVGVQRHLTAMCDAATLGGELSWARGLLHIGWEKSNDDRIIAIHGSVERSVSDAPSGSPIVLRFIDRKGTEETLELRPGDGSAIVQNSSLVGDEKDIRVIFCVRPNE